MARGVKDAEPIEPQHKPDATRGSKTWQPSALGKRFTDSGEWMFALEGIHAQLSRDGQTLRLPIGSCGGLTVTRGVIWSTVELEHPDGPFLLRGLPNHRASVLARCFTAARITAQETQRILDLTAEFDRAANQARLFTEALAIAIAVQLRTSGW
ncbi:hypothetical protein GY21_16305 [Cryobacterium roopkundense]|uniref:DNA helicase IV N-terminal domain-containing protein n=1 Tax=Cryobacterium roopkundense TaxID=1001240 RepID=A0A099J446_9MICO|nr:hypothetical protein [Cryobacterium roopkundense]KGJ72312.1 hypothetical protein GY21_16305 [Cryobacterium roopkundense]MBB5639907.1 hypothetical protein [Cryobacterium roopkundense]